MKGMKGKEAQTLLNMNAHTSNVAKTIRKNIKVIRKGAWHVMTGMIAGARPLM